AGRHSVFEMFLLARDPWKWVLGSRLYRLAILLQAEAAGLRCQREIDLHWASFFPAFAAMELSRMRTARAFPALLGN
ncbi:MAG: hypothetical protein C5B58_08400, partial [Acidobacteria bacterium]